MKCQPILLRYLKSELRKSDESAFSIVPSRLSLSTHRNGSKNSVESAELVYQPWNFENELFTARVYKRNYRIPTKDTVLRSPIAAAPVALRSVPLTPSESLSLDIHQMRPGYSIIHTVASTSDISFMEAILLSGADVNEKTHNEHLTPLYISARSGNAAMAKLLVYNEADVDNPSKVKDRPIHAVSRCSTGPELEVVSLLLEHGARVDEMNNRFERPLNLAVENGNSGLTKLLLEQGADPNICDIHLLRPIATACRKRDGNLEMVKILLDHGADVTSKGWPEKSFLHIAAMSGEQPELMRLLISKGVAFEIEPRTWPSPLE